MENIIGILLYDSFIELPGSNYTFGEKGRVLLGSPGGTGMVSLNWVVYIVCNTLHCFQYNVSGLCRCEPSNINVW